MKSDLHVHTLFSCDSRATMTEYCEEAIAQCIDYICFTEHVDCNKNDYCYGFYNPKAFFDEFKKIQQKYGDKITILCGIEFSEPHIYQKKLEELSKLPYDYIMGSVHYWDDNHFVSKMGGQETTFEEAYEKYWDVVYNAVSYGGFDGFAHIDIPKRYSKKSVWKKDTMIDIFKGMVKNNISLEINTSSLRKGLNETMPGKELLDLYIIAGGKNITVGADSHSKDELAKGYGKALDLLTPLLVNGFYRKRKFSAF